MSKIGIFYGPEKGSVDRVAQKVKAAIGEDQVEMISVNDATAADLTKFKKIIFGISTVGKETWDSEYANTDWAKFFPEIAQADFTDKVVAIFGLGDHITYPGHFVNAMGRLYQEIKKTSPTALVVGSVDPATYDFEESEAVIDGKFIGLPVDEDFEPEMTDERITTWVSQVKEAFDKF